MSSAIKPSQPSNFITWKQSFAALESDNLLWINSKAVSYVECNPRMHCNKII